MARNFNELFTATLNIIKSYATGLSQPANTENKHFFHRIHYLL